MRNRKDAKIVKNMDPAHKFMVNLKPRRSEAEVYINEAIDVTEVVKYMEKNKNKSDIKLTYFHIFATALAKVVYNKPLLNRFVINRRFYDKNDVSLSFVAKVAFTDDAEEYLSVLHAKKDDTLEDIKQKISGKVKNIRDNKKSHTNNAVKTVTDLPLFLRRFVINMLNFLDKHDLLPLSLVSDDIYHSTVILSNLGSIHCNAIYHNLTNFGTNSILATMGEIYKEEKLINGTLETRYYCNFGVTLDERIADGVYFAKAVNLLKYILAHPKLLEDEVSKKVEYVEK